MSGVNSLIPSGDGDNDDSGKVDEQAKTLIGHCYSTDSHDKYQDCSDWEWFESAAYEFAQGGGLMRKFAKAMAPSGSHHEWYSRLIVRMTQYFSVYAQREETVEQFGLETGPVPLMEFFEFSGEDIARYLRENPELADDFKEAMSELKEEEESAEAEADD